jgi:S-adenosylmethionine synthetase
VRQISDAVLDALLASDKSPAWPVRLRSKPRMVLLFGEITTSTYVDFSAVAGKTIKKIGYTDPRVWL